MKHPPPFFWLLCGYHIVCMTEVTALYVCVCVSVKIKFLQHSNEIQTCILYQIILLLV